MNGQIFSTSDLFRAVSDGSLRRLILRFADQYIAIDLSNPLSAHSITDQNASTPECSYCPVEGRLSFRENGTSSRYRTVDISTYEAWSSVDALRGQWYMIPTPPHSSWPCARRAPTRNFSLQ
ncbi:MAG: hypothetical protein V1926_00895 [Candidatus Peregrinibacteria bacterium]